MSKADRHPTDFEIELFLRNSPSLDASQRLRIEAHLVDCDSCRKDCERMRAFYGAVEERDDAPSPEAARIARAIVKDASRTARIVELYPRVRASGIPHAAPPLVALAAQDADLSARFAPLGALVSGDETMVMRIQRDNMNGDYLFHLTADETGAAAHALVTFDALAGDYITDGNGEIRLHPPEPLDPKQIALFIQPANAAFTIDASLLDALDADGKAEVEISTNRRLHFSLDASGGVLVEARQGNDRLGLRMLLLIGERADRYAPDGSGAVPVPKRALGTGLVLKCYLDTPR